MRLLALGGGGLLLVGCGPSGNGGVDLAGAPVVVPRADVPVGAFVVKGSVVVAQDTGGYYAMTAVCTHQDCILMPGSDSTCTGACALACPCHGSRYDANGHVVHGPATDDLVNYAVTLTPDTVVVDPSTTVPPGTRA